MPFERVFSPITINGVTLPNRICRTAHATGLARGVIGDDLIAYHEARARGGVGLTILEIAAVHPSSPAGIVAWDDSVIDGYRRLMERCRPHGMKVFQQIWHGGHHSLPADGTPPWSASALPSARVGVPAIAMDQARIDEIVRAFAETARRCKEGGLDGVEIHGAHGYLVGQFLSPLTNRRTDAYGGSFEARLKFAREVIAAVRAAVGPGYPVGIRLSSEEGVPGGLMADQSAAIARTLEADGGLDFFDVSLGGYLAFAKLIGGMHEPHGYELPKSEVVTAAVSLPRIVTGRITSIAEAEAVLAAGQADIVSMVRASIADPDVVRKAREGRVDETRPCIGCNQGCVGGIFGPAGRLGCVVNAAAGQEVRVTEERFKPVPTPRKILVVGGGPAGLEAARTAALLGHHVVLCEASPALGGQVRFARLAPTRAETGVITDWLAGELRRLEVDVRLGTPVDAALVTREAPDVVIIATGSKPRMDGFQAARPGDSLPGVDLPHVVNTWQLLGGDAPPATTAVVLDELGHYEAIGAAEFLRRQGVAVTFVTRHAQMGPLLEGAMTTEPAYQRLIGPGFELMTRSQLVEITPTTALIRSLDSGAERTVDARLVVLVSGNESEHTLADELKATGVKVRMVGDSLSARFLQVAIHEGHHAALAV